ILTEKYLLSLLKDVRKMYNIKKRLNILGFIIIMVVVFGLIIQFYYYNNIHRKETQKIISLSNDIVQSEITNDLMKKAQIISDVANYIAIEKWDKNLTSEYFKMLSEKNKDFSIIYFGTPENELIISDGWQPPSNFDLRQRPWYNKAIKEGKLIFTEILIDVSTNDLIITIAKPVYNPSGKLLGVVAGDVDINSVISLVQDKKHGENSFSFLIDGSGNILANPKYEYKFLWNIKKIDEVSKEAKSEMFQNKKGITELTMDGVEGYLAYVLVEGTDLRIGSFISLDEYMKSTIQYLRIFGITVLFSIFIFNILFMLQKKYFIDPIVNLHSDIQGINVEEDITYRVPIRKKDPFGILRNSINSTLDKSQEYFIRLEADEQELEAQNEELQASLQQLAAAEDELRVYNDQLVESEKQLKYLSYHDYLTNLYNRRFFVEELNRLDKKENYPLAILMADVNGLKLINDSFGHLKGDELLLKTAEVIKKSCRSHDIPCRIGGDEFVIILPRTEENEVENIVETIQRACSKEEVVSLELSISFGWEIKLHEDVNINEILKKAEDYLYKRKLFESPSMRGKTISAIINTLHEKNKREEQHSQRVSELCDSMGRALGLSVGEIKELKTVGLLHDIGKVAIEENILNKPGKLTEVEREEIKRHPEIGYRILSSVNDMSEMAEYVLAHHERWDGLGYPKGLKGYEIPLQGRIMAIADTFDAITSERSYRSALPVEFAVEELRKNAGTQFDPVLVEVFIENVIRNSK
ncbi:MAG: diguanylate cyclase, partial [Bacilli bacterium]